MTKMPNAYQIRVQGYFDQSLVEWFAPLILQNEPNGEALLIGEIRDQAELYGILIKLNNLNFPLIAFQPIWDKEKL
jgi:hypothetical protein